MKVIVFWSQNLVTLIDSSFRTPNIAQLKGCNQFNFTEDLCDCFLAIWNNSISARTRTSPCRHDLRNVTFFKATKKSFE